MKGKIIIGASTLFLVALLAIHAHSQDHGRGGMHEKMKKYAVENIHPVMKAERLKFEAELSNSEKAQIAELRTQAKALRAEGKGLRELHPGHGKHGKGTERPELSPEEREQLYQHKKAMRLLRTDA